LYSSTVIEDKLVHKPWFVAIMSGIVFTLFFIADFSGTIVGHIMSPVTGPVETNGLYGRFAVSLAMTVLFVLNIVVIGFFHRKIQILVVWLELGLLYLMSIYVFDLNIEFMRSKVWFMVSQGLFTTVYVSAISIVIAFVIAIFGAVAKLSNNGFAFAIASFYTSLFRGLPLLMQVYLIYLGLPQLGFVVDAVPAGIAALSLCYGAYMTEIFRAGIESVSRGQWEASHAIGFKFGLTMRKIILPQAIPLIIPPTGNQFIAMLKDSSLVSVIGVWEMMFLARTMGTKTFQHMEMLMLAAMLYWGMTIVLEAIQSRIERHYRRKGAR